ncbi:IS110 family transposase [bacterium]|nr:IS110 family transposase [bacterium]
MTTLYCAVDLHSNNGFYGIVEKSGKRVLGKRIVNDLNKVLDVLVPLKDKIKEIAVESTYNWYWLVDGLIENGFKDKVKLANPAAMKQYSGLKNTDDKTDAFFIAEQMRLGVLPTGYIYPKEDRHIRDILRRRSLFVKQRTAQILSLQNMVSRQTGSSVSAGEIKKLNFENFLEVLGNENNIFMAKQNLDTIRYLSEKIKMLENYVLPRAELKPEFERLLSIPGIGKILGLTIMYETGDISRFQKAGNYTSYCRCVRAIASSNQKKKGNNNRKNGNKYLSWALVEAAKKMKQFCPKAQKYYDRKLSRTINAVATKSLGAKISKCVFYILRDQGNFDLKKMFG